MVSTGSEERGQFTPDEEPTHRGSLLVQGSGSGSTGLKAPAQTLQELG